MEGLTMPQKKITNHVLRVDIPIGVHYGFNSN